MVQLDHIDDGNVFDFGNISDDYAKFRDVYPPQFFQKAYDFGLCGSGKTVLDLGTGTGVLPRHLARYGGKFFGVDISENQIFRARALSEGLDIEYQVARAEDIDFPDNTFDTVMACMCFTYFDKSILLPKILRVLKDEGRFAIMSLIWLPKESVIANASEDMILKYNPTWNGVGYDRPKFDAVGIPVSYKVDLSLGLEIETSVAFDVSISFTREAWHGRMKATRGLAASSLTREQLIAFEAEHRRYLNQQPESFDILHSAIFCVFRKT